MVTSKMERRPSEGVKRPKLVRPRVGLELVAEGLANPIFLTFAPGRRDLFIVDQVGKIFVQKEGTTKLAPFLDLSDEIVELDPGYDERGLLGLTFHPDFGSDRRFFVFYSAPLGSGAPQGWNCTNHLVEFRMDRDTDKVDISSRRILLSVDKPQMNHNGGHITFGPDGFLYVPLGDGGGQNDTGEGHTPNVGNAQDTDSLLGKILRIDVDSPGEGKEYAIPMDNPFAYGGGRPEIFAYGLRNPYHIAFDRGGDQQLFAGDAGQVRWEEVDIVVSGGNYGWNIKEGNHYFDTEDNMSPMLSTGPVEGLIDPIVEYPNLANRTGGMGAVVIGGYVYRGNRMPFLQGRYVFGDYTGATGKPDGRLFVASPPHDGGNWVMEELSVAGFHNGRLGHYLLSFGQDGENELYVLASRTEGPKGSSGKVYRMVPPEDSG